MKNFSQARNNLLTSRKRRVLYPVSSLISTSKTTSIKNFHLLTLATMKRLTSKLSSTKSMSFHIKSTRKCSPMCFLCLLTVREAVKFKKGKTKQLASILTDPDKVNPTKKKKKRKILSIFLPTSTSTDLTPSQQPTQLRSSQSIGMKGLSPKANRNNTTTQMKKRQDQTQ